MRRSWRPLPVLSLLIFLVGTPAAAQPVVPCGACLAIVVDADQVSLLPPDLAGLEILVRSPSLESKDVEHTSGRSRPAEAHPVC